MIGGGGVVSSLCLTRAYLPGAKLREKGGGGEAKALPHSSRAQGSWPSVHTWNQKTNRGTTLTLTLQKEIVRKLWLSFSSKVRAGDQLSRSVLLPVRFIYSDDVQGFSCKAFVLETLYYFLEFIV